MGMKPMKVMRYGSKYRYNQSRKKNSNKGKVIAIAVSLLLVIAVVLVIVRLVAINKAADDNGAINLQMHDGKHQS